MICDFRGGPANSGILSFQLESTGAFYRLGKHADPIWTVLATDVAFAPDGSLLVSDWVNGWEGLGKGRIYRLSDPEHAASEIVQEVQRLLAGKWAEREPDELSRLLAHADRRIRFEAQWELASRRDLETLLRLVRDNTAAMVARMHGVWGLAEIARLEAELSEPVVAAMRELVADEQPRLRAMAAKMLGDLGDAPSKKALRELIANDESPCVRYFAAMALGKLRDESAFLGIVSMLGKNQNADPALRHAGIMFLTRLGDEEKLAALDAHESEAVRRAAVVALRRMRSGKVARFLADGSPRVVLEAARAIHDESILVALPKLARLVEQKPQDPELVRRVLNANFRFGGSEPANRLARFAAEFSADAKLRAEALEMLAKWDAEAPLDRVLGSYRPLPARPRSEAHDALSARLDELMKKDDAVREKAIEVAAALGIKKIAPLLAKRISDPNQRPDARAGALQALAQLDRSTAIELARKTELESSSVVYAAALKVLARLDAKASLPKFIAATEAGDLAVRQQAWDILAKVEDAQATATISTGVKRYLAGELAADVHLNVLEAAEGRLTAKLQEAMREHARTLAEADSLGPWLTSLEGGNVEAGRRVFLEKTEVSCVRCHQVGRAGGQVGPNLTEIGKQRKRRYLLEAICLPDAQIAKGYETAVIVNVFGEVISGIVKEENDDFIDLIESDGTQKRIPLDEIEVRRKGKSSMPADLVKLISRRELRDLVAYLASLREDPRGEDDTE